uniref:Uncharacterized protein n=1 Tax=Scophthalmus maximus TaxID=52904 RepID=A0A8D3AF38_SCOMX
IHLTIILSINKYQHSVFSIYLFIYTLLTGGSDKMNTSFPILCQLQDFNPGSTFDLYMVIHHEAMIINLLKMIMFHKDSCEAADDSLLVLMDYCHRKLTLLASKATRENAKSHDPHNLTNSLSLKLMGKMSYHSNRYCMAASKMQLIDCCPWSRFREGEVEKYINSKWQEVPAEDCLKMTKLDGQVWISLYNLLLKEDCLRKYEFNNFNKNQLIKISTLLGKILIQQNTNVVWRQFLTHLAVTDPAPPKKELVLEQVHTLYNTHIFLLSTYFPVN